MDKLDDHLSRISTMWTALRAAHGGELAPAADAKAQIVERYSGAIYRYLLKILRDVDAADEVFQQFALQLVQDGFRHADPERGRFRDYLKVSLVRLVAAYRRKHWAGERAITFEDAIATDEEPIDNADDEAFAASCREEFLARAWAGLRAHEQQTGKPWHSVLHYRASHPDADSGQIAAELNQQLNVKRPFTADGVRQTLSRSRARFADILIDEIRNTLEDPTLDELESEIISLGLHPYCRDRLKRSR